LYALGRDLVRRLHPEVIDTLGVRNAVEDMVNHFDKIHAECRFEFRAAGDFSSLRGNTPITVYRIIQEALSNVVKHSQAKICRVQLNCFADRKILQLEVSDNGKGIIPGPSSMGVGLIGMRERVFGAGGKIYMSSEKTTGMVIFVELPIDLPLPESLT
jgi:two-component system sensor histidine kinase UhpB